MTITEPQQARCTIEWAPFTLAEGVDEATLLAASEVLQRDFLSTQPGFLSRDLLKGTGNQWVDLLYWESQAAAEAASQTAMRSPVCLAYFALMAGADQEDLAATVSHFAQVCRYP